MKSMQKINIPYGLSEELREDIERAEISIEGNRGSYYDDITYDNFNGRINYRAGN